MQNRTLAGAVDTHLGQGELDLLDLPVRALIKHLSSKEHVLSRDEIAALPDQLRLEEEIASDTREVRGRGIRGGSAKVGSVMAADTDRSSGQDERIRRILDRFKRRDSRTILSDRSLQDEIETGF